MVSGELFPAIRDGDIRAQIFDRLCSMKQIIISIYTFLENTKYLELCAKILKRLLPDKYKNSISKHFQALHTGQSSIKIQTSEFAFEDRKLLSSSHASWLSYRQLWLFALRHFSVMDGQKPRKDIGKPNAWQSGL